MSAQDVTLEGFIDAVRTVVAERGPGYVYPSDGNLASCTYGDRRDDPTLPDGATRCLFGVVLLEKLEVSYASVEDFEGGPVTSILSSLFFDFGLTRASVHLLGGDANEVQERQDAKRPYGQVLAGTLFERDDALDLLRAPVRPGSPTKVARGEELPGSISWREHTQAWRAHAEKYGASRSAEHIAREGGFSHAELRKLLGHAPKTFAAERG